MSAPATEVTLFQNRPAVLPVLFFGLNGTAFALASTYEARLYRLNNTAPFALASGANGKLTLSAAGPLPVVDTMTITLTADDLASIEGYGSIEIVDLGAANRPVAVIPARFVKEGTPYSSEFGRSVTVWAERVVVVAKAV